ncbi:Peptidyl-prolyl cis-trans isomerase D [Pontiella desulfatans]|uniref:Peptidyl-prolyl cis-trans isomerase D n=1 Tax=Pontiella desulfatans TaxID=2750659 RepID=A0A6C2UBZ8_PONDE|nr:SurA N-terminal domain-containing protein [Pontiella desulfatans]VGO17403.1 Peptidyl-prolyl cis-trans isomerase D [Pontiella desulfatans]
MAMMISKFHKIIQSKVVWGIFAVAICFAFVTVYTGQKASSGSNQQVDPAKEVAGRLWGEEVSRQEYGRAYQHVYVMYSMMMGRALNINDEINEVITRAAWQRIATLKKANQMGLNATPDQVRNMIVRQPLFQNQQTGGYDKNAYNAFVTGFLPRTGLNAKSFEMMMAENVIIEKASSMAAQGALVTDDEVKKAFHLYNDKITVEYAALPQSLAGTPEVSDEDAKAYYDANPEQFRLPEKAIVKYISFDISAYTNQVSVTDEMVANFYEQNKQHFVKPETATNAVPEYKPLEEVKGTIVDLHINGLAGQKAFEAADAVVAQLSDETTTFEQAAEQAGREIVKNTPAFGATDRVKGIDPTAPFAKAAFNLESDKAHYYSDPVVGRKSVYVIALEKKLPAFLPAFDVVKADAIEAARITASEKAYVEKSESVHKDVEAAIKAGTSFADAISKYNMELQTTLPFNATTQLEGDFANEIMGSTVQYDAGTLVDLISTPSDFLMAYVATKELADEEATLPSMRDELAAGIKQQKAAQLAQAWQESLLKEANFEDLTKKADEETGEES